MNECCEEKLHYCNAKATLECHEKMRFILSFVSCIGLYGNEDDMTRCDDDDGSVSFFIHSFVFLSVSMMKHDSTESHKRA